MEAVPLRAHGNKENLPPVSSTNGIGRKPADVGSCLKKSGDKGMARKPLADITHLFIGCSALTRSSSARASSGPATLQHLPSLCPKKRRALDDVDLLRATTRSAKSLRMGFR